MQVSKQLETAAIAGRSSQSEAKPTLAYRPDIDGLRAVAVMLVLAFHIGAFSVFGGFIGVDVFFVISGFLISSVILKDIEESRFSLIAFYERRIRRIIPALVVMLFITAILCCYYQLPSQLENSAKSLVAATFSVSNIYFLVTTSYFSNNDTKPFLPTWSLAVEEQFYIFFPIFLMLIRRYFPGRFKIAIVSVAIVSFIVSVFGVYAFPTAAFYLPVTRAWELLLGTMLAMNIFPRIESGIWRNLFAAAGLLGIVLCGFVYSGRVPFPGIAALAPCLGAALIIAAGESGSSFVGRLLSLKPVVFIGLISYSLYLWHMPIVIFQRMSMLQIPNASNHVLKGTTLLVSILVATLSWKFVETPFRKGSLMLKGASAFQFAAGSGIVLTMVGFGILALHGLPSRYTHQQLSLASYIDTDVPARSGTCFLESGGSTTKPYDAADCLRQDPSRKNYLLIGDSHAAQLYYGLTNVFPNINFLQATASGCEPSMQEKQVRLLDRLDNHLFGDICRPMMNYVYSDYLPKHHVDRVLIAARWEQEDLPRLDYTIRTLKGQGFDILLFGPIFQYDSDLPWLLVTSLRKNDPNLPLRHRLTRYDGLDAEMAQLAKNTWGVGYVSYFNMLCPDKSCTQYLGSDTPLQSDYGHLTRYGSMLVSEKMKTNSDFKMY
jgi:peptidoglycan/LPS O-acetylase OafA/YrhL